MLSVDDYQYCGALFRLISDCFCLTVSIGLPDCWFVALPDCVQGVVIPMRLGIRRGLAGGLGMGVSQGVLYCAYALSFWFGYAQTLQSQNDHVRVAGL